MDLTTVNGAFTFWVILFTGLASYEMGKAKVSGKWKKALIEIAVGGMAQAAGVFTVVYFLR